MPGMTVREFGTMLGKNAVSASYTNVQQINTANFESVWNHQTAKSESQVGMESSKTAGKDNASAGDSLQTKNAAKARVKDSDKSEARKPEEWSPEELEKAMEVLGVAATELIQEIAKTFGMSVEEIQSIMSELGMEQLDVLQQGTFSKLLLAAADAEDATALLTDDELYQDYQMLMERMKALMEECSDEMRMPSENLEEFLNADDLFGEIAVEADLNVEESSVEESDVLSDGGQNTVDAVDTVTDAQKGGQTSKSTEKHQSGAETKADDKGQHGNILLQSLKNQDAVPQLQQVTTAASMWDADTMDIMKQIMDYIKIQVKPDMSSLEMQLHPENLGTLHINLAAKDGAVTAQFVTQNDTVKAILESQMIQLKENFAEQGVKVDAVEVTVQTHQFEQNLEHGRGRQSSEAETKHKSRRIRLDGALTAEALDMMEQEDQLAAQMMAANGNTVDYTA